MAENRSSRVCEAEEDVCKRDVQALCYHCSKNLCRVHLVRHAQLMEEETRIELNVLTDKFNELSSQFNELSFSDDILQEPLYQLERWSNEAHRTIDQMVENKRIELYDQFHKYSQSFLRNKEEQLIKLNSKKEILRELIKESDASASQIAALQQSINEIEIYLNTQTMPIFDVIAQRANWFINIRSNPPETQVVSIDQIREFVITYVRLNGLIRNYFVKTNENGMMNDLIQCFIQQYTAIEETTRIEYNQIYTIDHLPKLDFILPVEVRNHRTHLVYQKNHILKKITNLDLIIFYETPYSLEDSNNPRILMPCFFRNKTTNQMFGLPIYLSVPRNRCRGTDIRDALHDILDKFYTHHLNNRLPYYDTFLQQIIDYVSKEIELKTTLENEIDFGRTATTLIVAFDDEYVDNIDWSYFNQRRF